MFSQPNAKPFSKAGVRPTSQAVTVEATQSQAPAVPMMAMVPAISMKAH
jgi:hypothetical protein